MKLQFIASIILSGVVFHPSAAQEVTATLQAAVESTAIPKSEILDEMVVTAPLQQTLFEQAQSISVLTGKSLQQSMEPTLGQTLSRQPGVSGSYFGPVASRPIIRGLDGDRIRILQNGLNTIDASGVSADHAVSFDVSNLTSIEMVRGPATMLYGSNAIGGVVNAVDNRIPTERMDTISGSLGSTYSSVDNGYRANLMIEGGNGPVAFHFETFTRAAEDLAIPGNSLSAEYRKQTGEAGSVGRLPSSNLRAEGMSGGLSYIWNAGYIGASVTSYHTNYASPAEEGITINMEQLRLDVRGAFYHPLPLIKEINYRLAWSDYEHTEFEGSEIGTIFANEGFDGRIEMKHEKVIGFEGVVGFQSDRSHFSANGEEAFLPSVITTSNSAFIFEERKIGALRLQMGARYDHISVESQDSDNPNFGSGSTRAFNNFSGSFGSIYNPIDDYAIALTTTYSERAPNYQELFANGAHIATGVYELGDSDLSTEKSLGIDLNVRKRTGWVTGSVGGYFNHFNHYIGLFPTGAVDAGSGFPVMEFRSTEADFLGAELETTFHLLHPVTDKPATADQSNLDLEFKADAVRARDRVTGAPLPRIPPFHLSTALAFQRGPLGIRFEGAYAAPQDRISSAELSTASYFLVNAVISYTLSRGPITTDLYLKGVNLTDTEAREHTSFLKDRAPLGGRGFVAGIKMTF
jgi:iron complex outermembrane receptor protein